MAEEWTKDETNVSAIRCSYCGRLYQDDQRYNMGFESDNWAVCFACFRKACNKASEAAAG